MIFEHSVLGDAAFMSKLTRLTEPTSFDVMAAFAMKIVGRG